MEAVEAMEVTHGGHGGWRRTIAWTRGKYFSVVTIGIPLHNYVKYVFSSSCHQQKKYYLLFQDLWEHSHPSQLIMIRLSVSSLQHDRHWKERSSEELGWKLHSEGSAAVFEFECSASAKTSCCAFHNFVLKCDKWSNPYSLWRPMSGPCLYDLYGIAWDTFL